MNILFNRSYLALIPGGNFEWYLEYENLQSGFYDIYVYAITDEFYGPTGLSIPTGSLYLDSFTDSATLYEDYETTQSKLFTNISVGPDGSLSIEGRCLSGIHDGIYYDECGIGGQNALI